MTTRIDTRFAELKQEGRAAFVTFVMCGDPDLATSLEIIKALPKAGADIIEIGMPFTDPMADGPAIQAAGLRALKAGTTLKKTLQVVRDFRAGDNATPIVLPIERKNWLVAVAAPSCARGAAFCTTSA